MATNIPEAKEINTVFSIFVFPFKVFIAKCKGKAEIIKINETNTMSIKLTVAINM